MIALEKPLQHLGSSEWTNVAKKIGWFSVFFEFVFSTIVVANRYKTTFAI